MSDEKIIIDFITKNYEVSIGSIDYVVVDKENKKVYTYNKKKEKNQIESIQSFNKHFIDIIGDFETDTGESSLNVLHRWFVSESKIIGKDMNYFLTKYDGNLGSEINRTKFLDKFSNTTNKMFLITQFNTHYESKYLKPKLREYFNIIDMSLGSYQLYHNIKNDFDDDLSYFSRIIEDMFNKEYSDYLFIKLNKYADTLNKKTNYEDIIESYSDDLEKETELHRHNIIKFLKDWYHINVLGDKLMPLFKEFVIRMGPTDWVVIWIGQGVLTTEKLLNHFKDEKEYSKIYIKQRYEDWYAEKIVEVSESYMKNSW
jgi:hypothetical protein